MHELTSLTALGEKLLYNLGVQQQILLYLLPDGNRVNRLWLGWVLSFSILQTLCMLSIPLISIMLGRWVPMMFWVVLITHCRALLSWAVHKPRQSFNICSQDAFYCSFVEVDENLAWELSQISLRNSQIQPFTGGHWVVCCADEQQGRTDHSW